MDNNAYRPEEFEGGKFYQLHKWLFIGCYKKLLNNNDRVIYSFLYDRHILSDFTSSQGEGEFVDEDGYVYFVYNQQKLADEIGISRDTVNNSLKKLEKIGLIYSVRMGNNMPNHMYLQKVNKDILEDNSDVGNSDIGKIRKRMSEKPTSECRKNPHPDVGKSDTNYNYTNNTKKSKTNFSSIQTEEAFEQKRMELKAKIDYESFENIEEQCLLEDLVNVLVSEVYCATENEISFGKVSKPRYVVEAVLNDNLCKGTAIGYINSMKVARNIKKPDKYILNTIFSKCLGSRTQGITSLF